MNYESVKPAGVQIPAGTTIFHACSGRVLGISATSIDAPLFSGVKYLSDCNTCARLVNLSGMAAELFIDPSPEQSGRCGNHYKAGGANPFVE